MKVLAIIPARKGSKRLPGKNLLPIAGKSLVQRAIETTLASKAFARVIVSSDDPEILRIASGYPGVTALQRPDAICTDTALAYLYVEHALSFLSDKRESDFDSVVIVQATSPLVLAADIIGVLEKLESSGADTVVSVSKIDFAVHPHKMKLLNGDKLHDYLVAENGVTAHHQLPEIYVRNGAIYASRTYVFQQHRVIGDDCRGFVMPRNRSVDINDQLDYDFAKFLIETHPNQ